MTSVVQNACVQASSHRVSDWFKNSSDDGSLVFDDDKDDDPDYVEAESEHSDESSADEEGVEERNERMRNVAALLVKDGYTWSSEEPQRRGRPLARDLVIHFPYAKGPAKEVKTPFESLLIKQLSFEMVKPFLQTRLETTTLRVAISEILSIPNEEKRQIFLRRQRRCCFCNRTPPKRVARF
ncbi:hypothetical protein J6590_089842 [Homalodisca vitripennis]|nr:hypothetical protein J6590_089842 [Homalodisca vitripennis]